MADENFLEPARAGQVATLRAAPGPAAAALPYGNARRVGYGLLWAGWTTLLVIAAIVSLLHGQVLGGLLALAIAALAGCYDYRIWTWRARRLLFFVIS